MDKRSRIALNYNEQVEWNALYDTYWFVINIADMDTELKEMITTLTLGFVKMMTNDNKHIIIDNLKFLLTSFKNRHLSQTL